MTNLPFTGPFRVTCEYLKKGNSWSSGYHKGIDLVGNDPNIYCTCDGVVLTVSNDPKGWGNYVRVQVNGTKLIHIFAHFADNSIRVKEGQKVSRATVLGRMGASGNTHGAHLHFQIEKSNTDRTVCDPTEWLGIPNKVGNYDSKNYHIKEDGKMAYKDQSSIPAWAKDSVEKVTAKGWMQGDTAGNFRPNDPVTRAELAVVLARENNL